MSKIFCIGLGKTGTTSITNALAALSYNTVHYKYAPLDKILTETIDEDDLKGIDAISDITVAICYKHLDQVFPGSKFIFTNRNIKSWLGSCEIAFSERYISKFYGTLQDVIFQKMYKTSYYKKDKFNEAYKNHKKDVKEYFKNRPEDILFFDMFAGDGWDKLCKFLNEPILDIEFPWSNKTSKVIEKLEKLIDNS